MNGETYVACVDGDLEYKRWSVDSVETFAFILNAFYASKFDKRLTLKRYEAGNLGCVDCEGKDILVIEK